MFRRSRTWLALVLVALALVNRLAAQPPASRPPTPVARQSSGPVELTATRDSITYTIRISDRAPALTDSIALELDVRAPTSYTIEFDPRETLAKQFQVWSLDAQAPVTQPDGSSRWSWRVVLDALAPGKQSVPTLDIRFRTAAQSTWQVASSKPIELTVAGTLSDEAGMETARPNPGLRQWPLELQWVVARILAGAVLGLAVLGSVAWYLARRTRPQRRAPVPVPHEIALRAIDELEQSGLAERGDWDRFFTRLSDIVRTYVEGRFGLRAPEQTSEEFLGSLDRSPVLTLVQRELMARFLEQSDWVKFARGTSTPSDAHSALASARDFVRTTAATKQAARSEPDAIR